MTLVRIDPERCRREGLCARICQKVFVQKGKGTVPEVVLEEACNSCGHCVILCPGGAIEQRNCPPEAIHPVDSGLIPSYEQVRQMLVARRSMRTFHDKPLEKTVIEQIIDGARFAPSAKNTQTTRYTVIQDKDLLRTIAVSTAQWLGSIAKKLKNPVWRNIYLMASGRDREQIRRWSIQFQQVADAMQNGRDMILFRAPVLLLFHGEKNIPFAEANANLALQNATMIAHSLGLGSFYTGYVVSAFSRRRSLPRLLRLPRGHRIFAGLAIGHPAVRFSQWIERNVPEITWM